VPDTRLVTCAELPAPDPDTPLIAAALEARGAVVAIDDWRDAAVDWADAPLTLIRSPWDYVDAYGDFTAWIAHVAAQTQLWNPPEILAWNTHKSYLLDLHGKGAPTVPTVVLLQGSAASLDGICDAQGWNTVVCKPAVGVGGVGSGRFDVGDPAGQDHLDAHLARGDVLVQPFLAGVESDGELSVVVIDGAVTHGLHKRAGAGEYRIHEEYGGTTELVAVDAAPAELALRVVDALPAPVLYARIDLLRDGGHWFVLEVEATEPSLWLDHAPTAVTDRFADAVMSRLGR
jgi:glutathione synthase/RimK-type ligase-like ATP-grasp enzyme